MARQTRTSAVAGTRRSASAVPVSSPVQSSPKRRRKTIRSPPPEQESDDDDDNDSDTSVLTAITTKSASTVSSRAPARRSTARTTAGRLSSTTATRTSARRTTRSTLTPAEIQEETLTVTPKPRSRQSTRTTGKLATPAPTESVGSTSPPDATPIPPATPTIKPDPDAEESPKGASDKENQIPLLAVPSLLGSVRKGQERTPPPEYVSPRKLEIARLAAAEAVAEDTGPRNRIVITHLVLNNFKSYAGRQVIGPFHTSFSSIVGPNGSGKSNVIDSLLFVFGFRASKMRQGKISALIHNSAAHPNLDSCSVEVHFEEITDLPGGGIEVVESSKIVVVRKAFKNNNSQYQINGRNSNYTEVTTMLRDKGIDLDHKRFLILQGEVESIAQMKPKAQNEHDDGLLEYLEDIIGTAKYKQPIEDGAKDVEALNEVCLEKSNRVAIVEKEKANLEDKKGTALSYIRDENELVRKQSALYQLYITECGNNVQITTEVIGTLQKELDEELAKHKGNEDEIKSLEKQHKKGTDELHALEKANADVAKELAKFDREDVQLQEKKKHKLAKQKKLQKTVQSSKHSLSEASTWIQNHSEEIETHTTKLANLEKSLSVEEKELDSIRDSLKVKTQGFTNEIEAKQKSLEPWTSQINEKQAAMALVQSELDLIREKEVSGVKALEEVAAKVAKSEGDKRGKEEELKESRRELGGFEKGVGEAGAEVKAAQVKTAKVYDALSQSRAKADDAKASLSASQTQGQVLTSLTRLRDSGRITGFHGRLGNLGTIDAKYDVAISTACPQLDNMVVDTVEAGQQCIEYLRKNNLGRANFIVLDRLPSRDLSTISTPESAPRLFDLVKPKEARFAAAFYSVLSDTIVAKDLTQANRIAYGAKRWRVVTLEGGLIDKSGTMTGGGTKVSRGGMSDKLVSDMSKEQVAKLEKDRDGLEAEYEAVRAEQVAAEKKLAGLEKRGPELEMQQSKLTLEIAALGKVMEDAKKQLSELKSQAVNATADKKQISTLEGKISKLQGEIDRLHASTAGIEGEIRALQEKIMEVGGVKLRLQKAKVDDLREQITALNERMTTCDVARAKSQKDVEKFSNLMKSSEEELETLAEELAGLEDDSKRCARDAETVRQKAEDAEHVLSVRADALKELKESLDERRGALTTTRAEEIEMRNRLEEHQKVLVDNQKRAKHWNEKLKHLDLNEYTSMLGDDVQDLVEFTEDELAEMDKEKLKAEIAMLEETIQNVKVDFSALDEYQRREKEYKERSKDLEDTTGQRDGAKKVCDDLRKRRLEEFMHGFNIISLRLKEMYQMITMGGNAELELVDSLDPFSEGILFSVMPPKKSWKNISNLSGGEKTLSSLALVFALHHYKPTPLYFMDEIDAALDFRNVSIVANYIKERTKNAQFIVISLRNNMFELAARLVGIYKTSNMTKSITIDNKDYLGMAPGA